MRRASSHAPSVVVIRERYCPHAQNLLLSSCPPYQKKARHAANVVTEACIEWRIILEVVECALQEGKLVPRMPVQLPKLDVEGGDV